MSGEIKQYSKFKLLYDDITDQQCADIIAHFVKRKMVGDIKEIIIHTETDDIVIKKRHKNDDLNDFTSYIYCSLIA